MIKSHSFSPNHKIVSKSPHNFNMPGNAPKTAPMNGPTGGGSAEPAGGGAQGPAPEMFCNGGAAYADGGYTGPPSRAEMAKDAVKSTLGIDRAVNSIGGAVGNARAGAQQDTNKKIDDAERSAVTGDE